jgi:hypothetical protein
MHPDYVAVAVVAARATAGRRTHAIDTHWNVYDAPISRGTQLAACGSYVSLQRFSTAPTCPACRQQQAIYDAMEF